MSYQEQGLEKIKDTLWYDLLTGKKLKKNVGEGNVLVLGDASCGKKSLINNILKILNQNNEISSLAEQSILKDFSGKFEEVYVLDYKYVTINKFSDDENFEELGKINFYIFNQKHEVRDRLTPSSSAVS
jgi:septin family protein